MVLYGPGQIGSKKGYSFGPKSYGKMWGITEVNESMVALAAVSVNSVNESGPV